MQLSILTKLVTKVVRHLNLADRETNGAVHWKSMCPKLRRAFQKEDGHTFSDSDWFTFIHIRSYQTRFLFCKNSNNVLLHVRANQGHSGVELIAFELTNHVVIPLRWKEFLCQRGSSFTANSILQTGLIASGKTHVRRATDSIIHSLGRFLGVRQKKNFNDDLSKARKVQHESKWKVSQDAVCWVKGTRKGLQFWQTRPHARILYDSVPADCIEKVVCLQGDKNLYL